MIAAKAACVNLNELTSEENKENCPTETARLHASIQQLSSELSELRHTVAAKDEQIKATLSQKEQLERMLEVSQFARANILYVVMSYLSVVLLFL